MQAVILSAGVGQRLRPLSLHVPKILIPIKCNPIIEHILDTLERSAIFSVAMNIHHLSDQIKKYIAHRPNSTVIPKLATETTLLGTAGGFSNAAYYLSNEEPVLLHNGDIYADIDFIPAIAKHRESGALLTLLVINGNNEIQVSDDSVVDIAGKIGRKGEHSYKYTGISIWDPIALRYLPKPGNSGCLLDSIVKILSDSPKAVKTYDIGDSLWYDIGSLSSYIDLHRTLLKNSIFPVDYKPPIGTKVEGFLCCCEGAHINPGASLQDVIVWKGAYMPYGINLKNAVVGPFGVVRA